LWHGRGPHEAHVLRRLATALRDDGHTVVTPNWDVSAADRGAAVLQASLDQAAAIAAQHPGAPLVLVGWSLGGTAALSLALAPSMAPGLVAVVGLASDVREHSPLDGTIPAERVRSGIDAPPIFLVHGLHDPVVPVADAEAFADGCRTAGVACSLTLVESDHAGVVGTEYDPLAGLCVPSDGPAATTGLDAAVHAVRAAAAR
jgi:predicted esterase